MDRRRFLGFVVFPAGIAALLAFLFFVARIDIFRSRTVEQSIAELLRSTDSGVRTKAALDLMRARAPQAAPALRAALADPDMAVRMASAQALAAVASATAVPDLAPLLKDGAPEVRRFAAFSLGALGDRSAREPLRAALADPVETVRWNAAVALARLRDAAGVPILDEMLRAPTPRSFGGAVRTLVPGAPVAPPEPDHDVHQSALLALALVGGAESIRPVETFIEAEVDPDLAPLAKEVLKKIKSRGP